MLSWPETLLNITNNDDHEQQCDNAKQIQSVFVSSAGRYTIILSRIAKTEVSNAMILSAIQQEYGVQQEEFQIQNYLVQDVPQTGEDLSKVFFHAKINIWGNVSDFKSAHSITAIERFRKIVNDGNTLIYDFQDLNYHYVLLHEIKYHN